MVKMRFRILIILMLVLSMISSSTLAYAYSSYDPSKSLFERTLGLSLTKLKNQEAYPVNTSAQTANGVYITFRGFVETKGEKKMKGFESLTPTAKKGMIYLLPLIEIENKGKEVFTLDVGGTRQIWAEADGEDLYQDIFAEAAGVMEDLDTFKQEKIAVNPGDKLTGYLGFCLPQGWKKVRILIFDSEAGYWKEDNEAFLFELAH